MVKLQEILDERELQTMLDQRYVKQTRDPHGNVLYNYTARAQFENEWNAVTMTCRGLIVNEHGDVIARPFSKFHNYSPDLLAELSTGQGSEHGADVGAGVHGAVVATDKMDGSLGILYRADGLRIATRGSFRSDQALHATKLLAEKYPDFEPHAGWTYLFEIVYPQNRIVVDYGERDDLVLLGAVEIETGRSVALEEVAKTWNGPVVPVLAHTTLEDALAAEPRENAEGMVLHFVAPDVRMKLKQEEYVRLHRIMTGVSARRVWEELSTGRDLNEWLEMVPDELYRFVTETRDALQSAHKAAVQSLEEELARIMSELPAQWDRRDLAERVLSSRHPLNRGLFALADGKDVSGLVWESLRPAEHIPFFQVEAE